DIPLQISRSLVALPAAVFSVRFDSLSNQQSLVNAEKQLFLIQKAYLDALGNKSTFSTPSGVTSTTIPTNFPTVPNPTLGPTLPTDLGMPPATKDFTNNDLLGQQDLTRLCQGT